MTNIFKLGLLLLGALALSLTFTIASEGKCGKGKCSSDKKVMKCASGKCGKDANQTEKKVPKKGKCGQGKCG